MKKLATIISTLSLAGTAGAQTSITSYDNSQAFFETMHSVVIIILVFLVSSFVLTLIKLFLEHQLKRNIVEKGVDENVIARLLPQNQKTQGNALKWFSLLTAIGIGLTVVSFYMPTAMYTAVVMTFSVAFGFLGYFFLAKRLNS